MKLHSPRQLAAACSIIFGALATACVDSSGPTQFTSTPQAAITPDTIPGAYIVILKWEVGNVESVAADLIEQRGGRTRETMKEIKMLSATLPPEAVEAIKHSPAVADVVPEIRYAHGGASVATGALTASINAISRSTTLM